MLATTRRDVIGEHMPVTQGELQELENCGVRGVSGSRARETWVPYVGSPFGLA